MWTLQGLSGSVKRAKRKAVGPNQRCAGSGRERREMRHTSLKALVVIAFALATSGSLTGAAAPTATSGSGPTFKHIGPLAFGPDGVLFAADGQDVSISALQLGQ